jgi:hypothetical protein
MKSLNRTAMAKAAHMLKADAETIMPKHITLNKNDTPQARTSQAKRGAPLQTPRRKQP